MCCDINKKNVLNENNNFDGTDDDAFVWWLNFLRILKNHFMMNFCDGLFFDNFVIELWLIDRILKFTRNNK